jgi:hypothetical protein
VGLVRCQKHPPSGRTRNYVASARPLGYPDTAAVCGSTHCEAPGLFWMESEESEAYERGERVFALANNMGTKIRVE